MAKGEGKAVFEALRPACVEVMSSPSVESLSVLETRLRELSQPIPPPLVTYLVLPVRTAIKRAGR